MQFFKKIGHIESPVKNGALGLLRRYSPALIVLAVIVLNFYIRNPATSSYKYGLAAAWILWSLFVFYNDSKAVRITGLMLTALMIYTQVDNIFYVHNSFDNNDLYSIWGIVGTYVLYMSGMIVTARVRLKWNDLANFGLLLAISFLIIAGRNCYDHYFYFYELMGWGEDIVPRIFFRCDALAGVLSAAFFILNTSGLNRRVGVVHLLYTLANYFDETRYTPTKTTESEWIVIGMITAFGVWLIWNYLHRARLATRIREGKKI